LLELILVVAIEQKLHREFCTSRGVVPVQVSSEMGSAALYIHTQKGGLICYHNFSSPIPVPDVRNPLWPAKWYESETFGRSRLWFHLCIDRPQNSRDISGTRMNCRET